MEDCDIINLFFARDEAALTEIVKKYGNFCTSISRNILHNDCDVEECVNGALLKLWNSIPPENPRYLMTYLGRIVRNISLNMLKAKHAKKRGAGECALIYDELTNILPTVNTVEDVYEGIALKEILNQWLDTLTPEQRMVFVGRYWYYDSISTISSKMGFSESKTKMLLSRMRKNLKEYLRNEEIHV